jgi:hypothetical protein
MDDYDIFVSYSHEDRERVRGFVGALVEQGWRVFWDRRIPAGESWRSYIGVPLGKAPIVIVCWSNHSIESEWVQQEADHAHRRRALLPVMIDAVVPPLGLAHIHAADLVEWMNSNRHELPEDLKWAILRKLPKVAPPARQADPVAVPTAAPVVAALPVAAPPPVPKAEPPPPPMVVAPPRPIAAELAQTAESAPEPVTPRSDRYELATICWVWVCALLSVFAVQAWLAIRPDASDLSSNAVGYSIGVFAHLALLLPVAWFAWRAHWRLPRAAIAIIAFGVAFLVMVVLLGLQDPLLRREATTIYHSFLIAMLASATAVAVLRWFWRIEPALTGWRITLATGLWYVAALGLPLGTFLISGEPRMFLHNWAAILSMQLLIVALLGAGIAMAVRSNWQLPLLAKALFALGVATLLFWAIGFTFQPPDRESWLMMAILVTAAILSVAVWQWRSRKQRA